jgi:soluble lytic murein transglycosylase-like protein
MTFAPASLPTRPRRPRDCATGALRVAIGAVALASALAARAQAPAPLAEATESAVRDEASMRVLLRHEGLAYENGEGVDRDPVRAVAAYCEAARLGDAESQFNLAWMYTNGRGVERNDSIAAFFFHAAAEQGLPQAQRMLSTVGGPSAFTPECMREPDPPPQLAAAPAAAVPVAARPGRALPTSAAPAVAAEARAGEIRSNAPKHLLDLVKKAAPDYKVHPQLALTIMEVESNFDVVALSPRNAKGLMQLIPETAERFNVRNAYDAEQNLRGGLAYLRWLLAYFEGDVALVAAAYNAGEGAVNRYRGVPPYAETRAYVQKVMANMTAAVLPFDAGAASPSPQLRLIREQRRSVR